jgi:hypothetical protein
MNDFASINTLEPYTGPEMECGDMRILHLTDKNHIIIEKIAGEQLKKLLKRGVVQRLQKTREYKFLFINHQKHPLFLNPVNDLIYFSDHPSKKEQTQNCIWYTGHFNRAISTEIDYYMIAYRGGNGYDGTCNYYRTKDLKGEELDIRIKKKQIISSIMTMYYRQRHKKAFNIELDKFVDFWVKYLFISGIGLLVMTLFI